VYYLAEAGYADNILTNAYAGEGSQAATEALMTLVPMGFPKYVFWCLGMNDGSDTSDAPSQTWARGRDAVISICKEYGITPVFGTIPSVPTINNEQKNAWIRSSGYRYVDIAKAVGAQANGTWYSGMLDDGVHPTEAGARAIYNRVLADFPEIMIEN
jgi:lysophospholipase L1-like esterase